MPPPHVIEPRFPGAAERYLNLGVYYDAAALQRRRSDVAAVMTEYRALYGRAYSLISAAEAAVRDMYRPLMTDSVADRIRARVKGVAVRELRCCGAGGRLKKRFLGALTCQGRITLFDTVDALAKRVYTVDNELDFAPLLLSAAAEAAISRGLSPIVCPDPMRPEEAAHVIIPELSLAFVSQTQAAQYPGEAYRHLRLDALADADALRAMRAEKRACSKLAAGLESEAVAALGRAKALHDELEAIYNPHVDFDGVYELADAHISQYS